MMVNASGDYSKGVCGLAGGCDETEFGCAYRIWKVMYSSRIRFPAIATAPRENPVRAHQNHATKPDGFIRGRYWFPSHVFTVKVTSPPPTTHPVGAYPSGALPSWRTRHLQSAVSKTLRCIALPMGSFCCRYTHNLRLLLRL